MGKRKGAKKQIKKKLVRKLEVVFDCPFCNHTQCIEIDLYVFIYYNDLIIILKYRKRSV